MGKGSAGTFSDGKLYTQIRDREHRIPWLLKEMVAAGAPEDILVKARPHIGTDPPDQGGAACAGGDHLPRRRVRFSSRVN